MFQIEPSSYFAIGGIAAAVAAGWAQVKNVASYLSNIVVVRDTFDLTTTQPLYQELRKHWKVVPGGPAVFRSEQHVFKDGTSHIVPFRLPPSKAVYRKGWCFIVASGSENLSLTYIRGTLDVKKLVSDALDSADARQANFNATLSRFHIEQVIGREKGAWAGGKQDNRESEQLSHSGAPLTRSDYQETWLDSSIDKSFKYDKAEWSFSVGEDPFEYLYYNSDIHEYIEQAQQWLEMGKWYMDRMIPWRRGWLLEGPGGTGKTSLAKALAQCLRVPIYQYHMSTLSDNELIYHWEAMRPPCIALVEDFDAVFDGREPTTEHKALSFDTVLNCISGINSANGIFLIVTTNRMDRIDPAMGVRQQSSHTGDSTEVSTRPGRIDTVIHVGNMEKQARTKLANRILRDWPEAIDALVENNPNTTPAHFQEVLIQYANRRIHEDGFNLFKHKPATSPL